MPISPKDPEVAIIEVSELRKLVDDKKDYDAGYVTALIELQNYIRMTFDMNKKDIAQILEMVQIMTKRCNTCGGWLFSDGSCIECESKPKPKKRATK